MSSSLFAQNGDDGFIKRSWNNMIAHYNIYFNATQKFESATSDLYEGHKDDFESFIDVYPYGTIDDAKNMRAPMDEVMKKASKVIQNKPGSKWADDAYFLIGQTQFFANDQFAAIETFQYVYSKYSSPDIKAKAQLWVMKSYIRQQKYSDAEAILGLIRETESPNRKHKAAVLLVAGDLYTKQGKYALAIEELTEAVEVVKNKQLCYRAYFLLGQLCLETKKYEESTAHFLKVIKMTTPYEFDFEANMGLTQVTTQSGGKGIKATKKNLKRMLKDDKNIDYFDQIYYELALLEFVEGNEDAGLEYLLMSSKNAGSNANQKTKTYLFLADYFFKGKEYDRSQKYYDSAVSVLQKDYPDYEAITAKHAILSTLIENIKEIQLQDSLLALAALPKDELDDKIDRIVKEERRRARIAKEEEEAQRQRDLLGSATPTPSPDGSSGGIWYFYNAAQIGRGANDFERQWGKRKHGDWWRFTNKVIAEEIIIEPEETDEPEDILTYNPDEDKEQQEALEGIEEDKLKYYEDIPFSSTAKLIANKRIEDGLIKVSKIYFDELKEYDISMVYLLRLLHAYPESKHQPECIFYLAKTEKLLGDTNAYDAYALRIANEYPNTAYNAILNNKEIEETGTDQEVIVLYEKMYNAFQAEAYDTVKQIKDQVAKDYAGNAIQAKFDYLYALTLGITEGEEAYINELEAITENYPGTEIANLAAYAIKLLREGKVAKGIDISMFSEELNNAHYYVITGKIEDVKIIERELSEYNAKFYPGQTFLIKSIEFDGKQLFYIKGINTKELAVDYHLEMKVNLSFLMDKGLKDVNSYAISEGNFKVLVKEQNELNYMVFFKINYPTEL